ncbi:TPA: hypothetical protein RG686_000837 [Morganella morganii]|nr:hypothetical protein [Morganella morganii]
MQKWIGRYFQKKEVIQFISALKQQDAADIAPLIIVATSYRNALKKNADIDLLKPALCIIKDPDILLIFRPEIELKQRNEEYEIAAGLMVWLHTLRCASDPLLRKYGRELWQELQRGFKYVEPFIYNTGIEVAVNTPYTKIPLDINEYDYFPEGLTPEVKN